MSSRPEPDLAPSSYSSTALKKLPARSSSLPHPCQSVALGLAARAVRSSVRAVSVAP